MPALARYQASRARADGCGRGRELAARLILILGCLRRFDGTMLSVTLPRCAAAFAIVANALKSMPARAIYDEPETILYSIRLFCPMSADGGQTFRYKFSRKVKLGENIYSPPLITTKPLNATLLFVPAAGLSHSEGSF